MIWALVRLGWTQEKVGELFGLTQTGIEGINEKLNRNIFVICQQFYQKINLLMRYAPLTTLAMILDGKEDLEKLEKLDIYKRYGIDPRVNPNSKH